MFGIKFFKNNKSKNFESDIMEKFIKDSDLENKLLEYKNRFLEEEVKKIYSDLGEKTFSDVTKCLCAMVTFENSLHSPKASAWYSSRCDLRAKVGFKVEDYQNFSRAFEILMYIYSIRNNIPYYFSIERDIFNSNDDVYYLELNNIVKNDKPFYIKYISKDFIENFKF